MGKPKGNGLIEIAGEKSSDHGFFCPKLVSFLNEEATIGTDQYSELWEQRFSEARQGNCAYADRCPIYARTTKNQSK